MRAHTHTRRKCLWQKVLCAPYLRTGPRTTPKKSFRLTSMPNPFISLLIFSVAPCSWNIKSTIFPRKVLGFLAPEKSASATRHELHFGHVKCQSQHEEKFNIANCNVRNVRQQSQYQDEFFVQICVRARANQSQWPTAESLREMSEKQGRQHHALRIRRVGPQDIFWLRFWVESIFILILFLTFSLRRLIEFAKNQPKSTTNWILQDKLSFKWWRKYNTF